MNLWLQILAPVIRRAERTRESAGRKKRWRKLNDEKERNKKRRR